MFPVLRPFLNKGGAGYSISRAETAERLKPHVARGLELLRSYSAALPAMRDREAADRLGALLPYFRTELGKLYESIFSAGGTVPTGTEIDFSRRDVGEGSALQMLTEREQRFGSAVKEEVDSVHHQERTRAILKSVAAGSNGRMDALRELASRRGRRED
jgi:hypothetical protein